MDGRYSNEVIHNVGVEVHGDAVRVGDVGLLIGEPHRAIPDPAWEAHSSFQVAAWGEGVREKVGPRRFP